MRHLLVGVALLAAGSAGAQNAGRAALGEVWVYPVMFEQALRPLAPLPGRMMRENLCPGLKPDDKGLLHKYEVDVKMRTRGYQAERWEVEDLKILNPSGCAPMDDEFARFMRTAVPEFAEPRKDLDKNGWTRIPDIQLRIVD